MIAESDLNSPRVVKSPEMGGYGFDAQWLDDFHHALYVLLDKKGKSRYEDFGTMEQLAKAYTDGFVHSGEFVTFRKRKHGASSVGISGEKFVAFNQNHDQVGNRVLGERFPRLVSFDRLRLAAAALFLSPYIPLLFMGEEYGEDNPFFYFVSHSDKSLIKAVREGRKKEFEGYKWHTEPPDPQATETYEQSKIDLTKKVVDKNRILLEWNKTLISFRKKYLALQNTQKNDLRVYLPGTQCMILHRRSEDERQHLLGLFNFSESEEKVEVPSVFHSWEKVLDSEDIRWQTKTHPEGKKTMPPEIIARQILAIKPCSIVVYINKEIGND
jgi:maltooligosyltrehalose trehalohydrolase